MHAGIDDIPGMCAWSPASVAARPGTVIDANSSEPSVRAASRVPFPASFGSATGSGSSGGDG